MEVLYLFVMLNEINILMLYIFMYIIYPLLSQFPIKIGQLKSSIEDLSTVWKFHDFSIKWILREINLGIQEVQNLPFHHIQRL